MSAGLKKWWRKRKKGKQQRRKKSATELHKSAITEHAVQNNLMDKDDGCIFVFMSSDSMIKNLGRVWHAYIRTSGQFYKLQLTSIDSRHFTQSELSLGWSDLHEIKNVIFCISSPD